MTGMQRWLVVVAVALPGLVLAAAGYHHPGGLDVSTANMWWTAHVPLIPVFPLLGVMAWALVRDEPGPVKALVVVGAYITAASTPRWTAWPGSRPGSCWRPRGAGSSRSSN